VDPSDICPFILLLFYGNISEEGGMFMPSSELKNMLRAVIQEEMQTVGKEVRIIVQEELKPVHQELQQVNTRLYKLEKGQRKLQQDVSTIKKEIHAVWDDILRLDNRLIVQEKKTSL